MIISYRFQTSHGRWPAPSDLNARHLCVNKFPEPITLIPKSYLFIVKLVSENTDTFSELFKGTR